MPARLFLLLLLALAGSESFGKIYYSKTEAMKLAFGDDFQVETLPLFFTDEQILKIERLARVKVDSAFFTFYVGRDQDKILGYAAIETHNVRTKPETLLIVLTPGGKPNAIHVLAFHEPPEYQPPDRWFAQFYHRVLEVLDFNKEIHGITGATLSARGALSSVRKVMAIYQIVMPAKEATEHVVNSK